MLRGNGDTRVRVSAALRLGELHEPATVPALVDALNSARDTALKAAIVSALGAIGDAQALPALDPLTRGSGDVATQARRAVASIRSAGGGSSPDPSNGSTAVATGTTENAKVLVTVGPVNNAASAPQTVVQVAQQAMRDALAQRGEVLVHSGSSSQAQQIMRSRRLLGHSLSPNIQVLQPQGTTVHVEVNVAVSSYPGGALEFDSPSSITLSGSTSDPVTAQQNAVRRAVQAAVGRAVNQIVSGM